jgi:hypothetical protein
VRFQYLFVRKRLKHYQNKSLFSKKDVKDEGRNEDAHAHYESYAKREIHENTLSFTKQLE